MSALPPLRLQEDIKQKLGTTEFVTDDPEYAHITIDPNICQTCPDQMCMWGCPTDCYNLINGEMKFTYEDCVECGTCFVTCRHGSVSWSHPRGSFGVKYKYG